MMPRLHRLRLHNLKNAITARGFVGAGVVWQGGFVDAPGAWVLPDTDFAVNTAGNSRKS